MKIMFWNKIRAEIDTGEITLDQYKEMKQWLNENKIKHTDRFEEGSNSEGGWGYNVWIKMKDLHEDTHSHTFKFYREKDAVFFKTAWGGVDV